MKAVGIAELEAVHVRVPLRKPVKHASHARTETDNLVVRCVLTDGTVGFGEGVPREYVTGETIDSAVELLKRADLRKQFPACDSFDAVVSMVERFALPPVPGDDRQCQGNAARCAVELAVLDAYGRCYGEPLMNVTKRVLPDLYTPVEQVRYSGMILSAKGWKCRFMAWAVRVYGFRQIKVKVGIAGQNDAKRLTAIRSRVGKGMDLRVDANEAWAPDEAADRIKELEPAGITSVEQPVRHEDVSAIADVRKRIGTPVMLDESLCSMVDAERAHAGGWCDLFNLRLSKCGGFLPTLRLAAFAKQHNLGYQLGCQVGETGILSAAGRQFACSVGGIRYLEGSYDRHLVRERLTHDDLSFGRGGKAPMLVGSGLGAVVDPARLDRIAVRRERLLG